MTVLNGNKLNPPRRGKWIVKSRDVNNDQIWETYDSKEEASDRDYELEKARRQKIESTLNRKCSLKELWDYYTIYFQGLIDNKLMKQASLSATTRRMKHHVLPVLGNRKVRQITKGDVRRLIKALRQKQARNAHNQLLGRPLKKSGVQAIIVSLSSVLTYAVSKDLLQFNPAKDLGMDAGIARSRVEKSEAVQKQKALTRSEKKRVLEIAAKRCSPMFYTLLCILLETGMRIGEAIALRWRDLDLNGDEAEDGQATILIERSYDHENGVLDLPKSNVSRRVDINDDLLPILISYKGTESRDPEALVFAPRYAKSGYLHHSTVQYWVKKACQLAGITRHFVTHYLRHTYASILLTTPGVEIKYVARQLGHSETETTRLYSEWLPDRCQTALRTKGGSNLDANSASSDYEGPQSVVLSPH